MQQEEANNMTKKDIILITLFTLFILWFTVAVTKWSNYDPELQAINIKLDNISDNLDIMQEEYYIFEKVELNKYDLPM